ncbi:MAG: recombination protein O N-terminal domain-containing protein [Synergistaceae bacterium]|nr:recombination protein O N-terminal domain-containing protein [Synergistaceae bacterium]
MPSDYVIKSSGVILFRKSYGENTLWTKLFLKEYGIITATMPTAGKNSFGGDSEPFCWGTFALKRKPKGKNYRVEDIDIYEDMLNIRKAPDTILTAFKWSKAVLKYLLDDQPDNDLLANLYWNMKLLCEKIVPADASDWRFIWNWLNLWGIAPDIMQFCSTKNFNRDETILLAQLTKVDTKNVIKIFSSPLSNNIRKNIFKYAAESAYKFLNEK